MVVEAWRWARDGALLGLFLPSVAVAPLAGFACWYDGATPPVEIYGMVAWVTVVAVGFGAAAGAGSALLVDFLEHVAAPLAWGVGFPTGVAGGLVAAAALNLWNGFYRGPGGGPELALIAACTVVTVPAHAAYLAVVRRGRSGAAPLVLAVALATVAAGPALFGGLAVLASLDRY